MRRVVVTGLGLVSPLGNTVSESWSALLAGRSAIGPITTFDASAFNCRIAAQVKNFDASKVLGIKDARRFESFTAYGVTAAAEALDDASLLFTDDDPAACRAGALIGSGIGGIVTKCRDYAAYLTGGPRKFSPFIVPASIINSTAGELSILRHLRGPNLAVGTACTTGLHAVGEAAWIIARDDADVMVAGGTESPIHPAAIGGFDNIRALSRRNDDPQAASRPFDSARDGFVLGEGAGMLVLEEYEHAVSRGAKIYCEIIGYGLNADGYHFTAPRSEGAAECMRLALKRAKIAPEDVDMLNAHGTSTPMGDVSEAQAVRAVFGDATDKLRVTSTKGATGHALGGAGGIESVFTVLSIRDQVVPPTLNLTEQDPKCPIRICTGKPEYMPVNVAMKNNFGFGGTNGTLIFRKLETD